MDLDNKLIADLYRRHASSICGYYFELCIMDNETESVPKTRSEIMLLKFVRIADLFPDTPRMSHKALHNAVKCLLFIDRHLFPLDPVL